MQNDDPVFDYAEQRPYFLGGDAAMMQWLNENIRYPVEAFQQGIQGRVVVQFIVERNGSISNVQVVENARGVVNNPYLNAEAIRIVQAMPNWQPARHGGETVRVRFTLPMTFRLAD